MASYHPHPVSIVARPSPDPADLILLTPGPVRTSPDVRDAALRADFSHRDPAFGRLLEDVSRDVREVAGAPAHDVIFLAGGATAATEAAFGSLLDRHRTLLVPSNGAFGERLAEIAGVLGVAVRRLQFKWGEPVSIEAVQDALASDADIRAVAMVQHETSVGSLNPVDAVGAAAHRAGATFFVDAVSSLGAETFDARRAHASVVIGTTNKCLHGITGASFVLVHPEAWKTGSTGEPRSVYFDLRRYRGTNGSMRIPFTPPVHSLAALRGALGELANSGGVAARQRHYRELNARIRSGLAEQGLRPLFEAMARSCSLTVATVPNGETFEGFYDAIRREGFVIYQAKEALRDRCFQVANMGHLDMATIDRFLEAVRRVVTAANGRTGPVGV